MTQEQIKNNIFFDETGKQILVGDLLKIYHFGKGNRTKYMYHVVVMEETQDFPVMALRCYMNENPHYRLYQVCRNEQLVYKGAKIINMYDWASERKRIKIKN